MSKIHCLHCKCNVGCIQTHIIIRTTVVIISDDWVQKRSRLYYFSRYTKRYSEAKTDCEETHDASILTIRNEAENNFIESHLKKYVQLPDNQLLQITPFDPPLPGNSLDSVYMLDPSARTSGLFHVL